MSKNKALDVARLLDLLDSQKSVTEVFVKEYQNPYLNGLAVGTSWTVPLHLFESAVYHMTVRAYVRDKDTVEFSLEHVNGERMAMVLLRRNPYGEQYPRASDD